MKANQIKEDMLVETIDSTLRSRNKIKGAKQGIIYNPEIKKDGTLSKVLVLFDKEAEPRYVPISRLKVRNS
jgi:hypothetical protein